MRHRTGQNRQQFGLFATPLEEMIAPDNMVRVVDAFVGAIGLVQLGFVHVRAHQRGAPPYHVEYLDELNRADAAIGRGEEPAGRPETIHNALDEIQKRTQKLEGLLDLLHTAQEEYPSVRQIPRGAGGSVRIGVWVWKNSAWCGATGWIRGWCVLSARKGRGFFHNLRSLQGYSNFYQ